MTTGIMTLFQLLSVPIFLKYWGVPLYGEWITLNALIAYFQVTDVGLNTATANRLTFCHAKKEYDQCNVLINNNVIFVVCAFSLVLVALAGLIELGVPTRFFRFSVMSPGVLNACLLLVFAQVFVGTLNNLLSGVYRATDNFARGVMVDNAIRISENAGLLLAVVARLSLPAVLLVVVGVKLIGIVVKYVDSRRLYRFTLHIRYFRWDELKQMWAPATAFFLFPVSSSIALQAPVVLVNFFLGSGVVVAFNTTRMLANFGRAAIDILQRSAWPEFSLAYGRRDIESMKWLNRNTVFSAFVVILAISLCLAFFGGHIYRLWTGGHVEFNAALFYLFLVTSVANTLWSSSSIVLQATNNHNWLSFLYLCAAVVCLTLSFLFLRFTGDLNYIPLAMLASDLMMLVYAVRRSLSLTGDSLSDIRAKYLGDVRTMVASLVKS